MPATEATKGGLLILKINIVPLCTLYFLHYSAVHRRLICLEKVNSLSGGENKIGEESRHNYSYQKLDIKTIERGIITYSLEWEEGITSLFASFYMTGFLNEKPLANLRDDMKRIGISRSFRTSDPEDHIASLCEMMSGIITNHFILPFT